MIKMIIRFLNFTGLTVVLPLLGFSQARWATEIYFRKRLIPLPFDAFGLAVGIGVFCACLSLGLFILALLAKKGGNE